MSYNDSASFLEKLIVAGEQAGQKVAVLPQHNPLNDARHSARIMILAMVKLREQRMLAAGTIVRG